METNAREPTLTHIGPGGEARMVDVGDKEVTRREAAASAVVRMATSTLDALLRGTLPKGPAVATARVAGILAAKRTAEWIPLCHSLPVDAVRIEFTRTGTDELHILCTARATARTGVEMEALTGAAAAALTIYDMAKADDRGIVIGPIQLESKSGGRRGDYHRGDASTPEGRDKG